MMQFLSGIATIDLFEYVVYFPCLKATQLVLEAIFGEKGRILLLTIILKWQNYYLLNQH